jgi:hypothetical protein
VVERKPLYHRNPLRFWRVAAGLLARLLLASVFLAHARLSPAGRDSPSTLQPRR